MKNNKKTLNKKQIQVVCVGGLIFNQKREILLVQRNQPDFKPWDGKWSLPGGHLEFGEEPKKALHREIKEELGVKIKILKDNPYVVSYVLDLGKIIYHGLLLGYPCRIIKGKAKIVIQENRDLQWIKPEKINFQNCVPATDIFIKQLLGS